MSEVTNIQEAIQQLVCGQHLTLAQTEAIFTDIMTGNTTDAQIASFVTAMRMKGETIDEITACAKVMRAQCAKIFPREDVMDIVGTGGDNANLFNVSTLASIVVAAAGVRVAKHGNRSVSSKCGSADVLEALGVNIMLTPEQSEKMLYDVGICFLFAPLYHASMKYAAPVRKQLGVRTLFNMLGPLSNPAAATMCLIGVYDDSLAAPFANVLKNLGVKRAMVVCGHDGLDEVSLCTSTTVCEVNGDAINSFFLNPAQLGLSLCRPEELVGGDPAVNADIAMSILRGKPGPQKDMVVLNASLCLYMDNQNMTLRECVNRAREIIDSGKALAKLEEMVTYSRQFAGEDLT